MKFIEIHLLHLSFWHAASTHKLHYIGMPFCFALDPQIVLFVSSLDCAGTGNNNKAYVYQITAFAAAIIDTVSPGYLEGKCHYRVKCDLDYLSLLTKGKTNGEPRLASVPAFDFVG